MVIQEGESVYTMVGCLLEVRSIILCMSASHTTEVPLERSTIWAPSRRLRRHPERNLVHRQARQGRAWVPRRGWESGLFFVKCLSASENVLINNVRIKVF